MEMMNTKLDAVNLCLAAIGREPVATLDTPDLDAAMAIANIDQANRDIQNNGGRGWWFNREAGWRLSPNDKGEIYLPNNVLSVLEARPHFYSPGHGLAVRGGRVYDTNRHTFDMRELGDLEFTLLLLIPYEHMPSSAQSAIAWTARRVFSDDTIGDPNQHQRDMMNEQRAMAMLFSEDSRTFRRNYLRDNPRVRYQVGRIGGLNNL